jgi:catechol 2,3-dioxygenase
MECPVVENSLQSNNRGMQTAIHPDTTVGPVTLTTANLERAVKFYTGNLGLKLHNRQTSTARLGTGEADLLILAEHPGATRYPRTTGLYHFAILLPTRAALARALRHLAETRTPVQGAADHLVSEAIYLSDPDGNGIELYRDRPRSEWIFDGEFIRMATDPLDVQSLLAEPAEPEQSGPSLPPGTTMGHIHLQVDDLPASEKFYREILGMRLMARLGRSASFLSAGGYHHHIAINTWGGAGIPAPPENAIGLREFVLTVPDTAELDRLATNLSEQEIPFKQTPAGLLLRDPSQNRLKVTTSETPTA